MRCSRGLVALLTLLTMLGALVAVPAPTQAASSAASYLVEARKYTNHARTTNGRPALANDACLARYARAQAERMARSGTMAHQELGPILRACRLSRVGENVAYVGSGDTGRGVVRAWMGSAPHRANILNTGYRHYGMGAVLRNGRWWVVQVFGRKA